MGGLITFIANSDSSQTNFNQAQGTFNSTTVGSCQVYTAGAPADIFAAVNSQAATNDGKVYLRQSKTDLYLYNEQFTSCWVKCTWFKVKKSIAVNEFATIGALLQDQTIGLDFYATPYTTGATAQRYLKFGKTKLFKMNGGGIKHLKVNVKFRSPLLVTKNDYADGFFTATPITRGVIVKIIPAPLLFVNTASTTYTGIAPAPFGLAILEQNLTSVYAVGNDNPAIAFSGLPVPSGAPTNRKLEYGTADKSSFTA